MKILIIGASGFLGGTVYYKCKKKGFEVLGTYCVHRENSEYVELNVFDEVYFKLILFAINDFTESVGKIFPAGSVFFLIFECEVVGFLRTNDSAVGLRYIEGGTKGKVADGSL